ncbi:hypothetical protein [Streptomyces sp. C10-9-1]|uniref:hypothetical protein n=1 Tax=Streptomyces sp. C10-9-1 TaxID=1859285 RepID=UPI003D75B706
MIKKTCLAATLVAAALLVPATSAAAAPPDHLDWLESTRADPIGFVNWKLELPIPAHYAPSPKRLVR